MELYEGTLVYYLPKAPGRPRDLYRIKYPDGDEEDVTKAELLRQQQLAIRVAQERKQQQQQITNLSSKPTTLLQQPSAVPPSDEEDNPVYWYAGLCVLIVFVDDTKKSHTRNKEGEALHKRLMDQFIKDGLAMTTHDLDSTPEGINFLGTHIEKFSNDQGSGLAISQPQQVIKVAEALQEMGTPPSTTTYTPLLKEWLALVAQSHLHITSAHNTFQFLHLLGGVSYQMSTGRVHPMVSLLAQQSAHATPLDTAALVQVAQFHQTIGHIPTTFYRNPTATDIRIPTWR